ncbi:MAG: NAD synthetase [Acidobacteria bacterium]|nr:NAD synthetase [Acidobacteriota bacterium]
MAQSWINLAYLIASALFILGLQGLTSPRTARNGNLIGALGMLVAIVATLVDRKIISFELIALGIGVGALLGVVAAIRVQMTAMPEMVAILNGFGGAASALVAATAVLAPEMIPDVPPLQLYGSSAASSLIGAVTLTGSLVAFLKLAGWLNWNPRGGAYQMLSGGSALVALALSVWYTADPSRLELFWALTAVSAIYGVLFTASVGGADMPVVIALLNSLSGLAASATGFVLNNNVLIIAGSLVGASGFILTAIMCKAMNRSLWDVLSGDLGEAGAAGPSADDVYAGRIKSAGPDEIAMLFDVATKVAIVPGYGMAVAQAQHAVRDLANLLESRGIEVVYGIHPVAGRMPGHMNVLLAEADVPYDKLLDMDTINPMFPEIDVAIVLGANDVVNPSARDQKGSPIYGMPILNVDKARTVVVVKRSLSPGFAGIPNPLFANDNTLMYFADGKEAVRALTHAVKEL